VADTADTGVSNAVLDELSLDYLASRAPELGGVRESDVEIGDWIIVRTRNSTYALRVNGDGTFDASGGWFRKHPRAGERLRVAGCTWGGSALLTGVIAVPGMCLEFANRVTTTRIREVRHIRAVAGATVH
jgi:hypothetical protein